MEYRYGLETGSKKHRCPQCNKKTFVRYTDKHTGEYLPPEFGRCDREQKCAYHNTPKGEFKNEVEISYTPPQPPSYHPYELVSQSGRNFKQNNFVQFLKTVFTPDEVKTVIQNYLIGTSKHWPGATVFWQMDDQMNVRHGKIMLYATTTGKRAKNATGKAYISSVRSVLKLKRHNLKQCPFGLHLNSVNYGKTVAVVEGEKTAILMSLFKPEYVWMATGSKGGFKYEMLKSLSGCKVVAFPDKGELYDWQSRAIELRAMGLHISVSEWLENTECLAGTDLADVYINAFSSTKTPKTKIKQRETAQYARAHVRAYLSHSSKKTELIRTATEKKALSMAQINPYLKDLINIFDLTDKNGMAINI